jgi:hypothetical protein
MLAVSWAFESEMDLVVVARMGRRRRSDIMGLMLRRDTSDLQHDRGIEGRLHRAAKAWTLWFGVGELVVDEMVRLNGDAEVSVMSVIG